MAIAFGQSAEHSLDFGATSVGVTFGATPSNDDIIYLFYEQSVAGPATRTWPSGFTELVAGDGGGGNFIALAWKRAASEGSATYTLSLGDNGDSNQEMLGVTYTGAATSGDPNEVVGTIGTASGTPNNVASITTLTDGAAHLIFNGSNDGQGAMSATGYTRDAQSATFKRVGLLRKIIATAGATGTVSVANMAASGQNTWVSLSLKPAGGGGVTVGGPLAGGKLAGGFLAGGRLAHITKFHAPAWAQRPSGLYIPRRAA